MSENENKIDKQKIFRLALLVIPIVFLVVIIILAVSLVSVNYKLDEAQEKYEQDEEYIKKQSSRVYEYYNEKDVVLLDDYTFGEIFLRALKNVPRCSYDLDSIEEENGYKYYTENGEKVSKTGIDVSYFQGDIDWEAVKESGIDFAIIRVGYRGYESGNINADQRFDEYMRDARAAGIETGVYFYSQAVTEEEALEEAEFVLGKLKGHKVTYPVVFDWEMVVGESSARTNNMPVLELTDLHAAFCNRIAEAGYIPMIYASKRQALFKIDLDALAGFDFWLAEYTDRPTYPYDFRIWQYSSDAKVNGIEGNVDINISFTDYSELRTTVNDYSEESEDVEETAVEDVENDE